MLRKIFSGPKYNTMLQGQNKILIKIRYFNQKKKKNIQESRASRLESSTKLR